MRPANRLKLAGARAGVAIDPVCLQGGLHPVPQILINDRVVLAWIDLVLMHDLAAIDAVLQYEIERPPGNRLAPCGHGAVRRLLTMPAASRCSLSRRTERSS